MGLERIVSGGQTGADRAALDVALALGMPCGGWCPAGRLAEDGALDVRYPLRETPTADPAQRTEWNVRDSDATLVLLLGGETTSPGTLRTLALARRLERPHRVVALGPAAPAGAAAETRAWLGAVTARTLNVAGPRESEAPGIYAAARGFLQAVLGAERAGR